MLCLKVACISLSLRPAFRNNNSKLHSVIRLLTFLCITCITFFFHIIIRESVLEIVNLGCSSGFPLPILIVESRRQHISVHLSLKYFDMQLAYLKIIIIYMVSSYTKLH